MTPETENNINEAINWLQQTGGSIQNFAAEQAPIYCREVIAWEFWSAMFYLVISASMLIAAAYLGKKARSLFKEDELWEPWAAISGFIIVVFGLLGCIACECVIKATVAPRLIIVEHLRGINK